MGSPVRWWQPSLDGSDRPLSIDPGFGALERHWLDPESWIDVVPTWVRGSDVLFERLVHGIEWGERTRWMYERRVSEPRLTSWWGDPRAMVAARPELSVIEDMRHALGAHYGVAFDSVGFNLYRDGRDSVAWHGDKIAEAIEQPIVALVSLGERRPFKVRPKGGGASTAFVVGYGDLLVTGGRTQRSWQHSVPKRAAAGPRISIAFRHGAT